MIIANTLYELQGIHLFSNEALNTLKYLQDAEIFTTFKMTSTWAESHIKDYPMFRINVTRDSEVIWISDLEPRLNPFPSFEYILDRVDPDTQAKLLFHLDILITNTYMVVDKETGRYVSVNRRN